VRLRSDVLKVFYSVDTTAETNVKVEFDVERTPLQVELFMFLTLRGSFKVVLMMDSEKSL